MITRATLSTIEQGLPKYRSMLAGNTAFSPGSFESIATSTVGAGGASSVTFSSIPATYTHLQLREYSLATRATIAIGQNQYEFNSDTTANNYSQHYFYGDGSGINVGLDTSSGYIWGAPGTTATDASGTNTLIFGISVMDILDYTNGSKYKTTRTLSGVDLNGTIGGAGGRIGFASGNWKSFSTINSIRIVPQTGNFKQYTHFALYGIKST